MALRKSYRTWAHGFAGRRVERMRPTEDPEGADEEKGRAQFMLTEPRL